MTFGGTITTGTTEIEFVIPLSKSFQNIKNVNLKNTSMQVRIPSGGYILGNSTSLEEVENFNCYICSGLGIRCHKIFDFAFNCTNNTPISVTITTDIIFN